MLVWKEGRVTVLMDWEEVCISKSMQRAGRKVVGTEEPSFQKKQIES